MKIKKMIKRILLLLSFCILFLLIIFIYVNIGIRSDPYTGLDKLPPTIIPKYDISNDWWKSTTVYQIYPRSYKDSNGDGIGDLPGIIDKLDYIRDLGFETIWISPFFESPQMDHGYDVSDYQLIDADYGNLALVDSLIDEVHKRDMKIVFDLVLNHTSIEHGWFVESRSSKNNPKSDWYVWRDGKNGGPPNNWNNILGQRNAWEYVPERDQWYYAVFLPFQPDLNMRNPEVKKQMFDIVRFWLEKGVDGFRLDIFNLIMEDPEFRNNPRTWRYLPNLEKRAWLFEKHKYNFHHPDVLTFAKEIRAVLEEYTNRFLVGEVFGTHFDMRQLMGEENHDGLHLVFLFDFIEHFDFSAAYFKKQLKLYETFYPAPLVPTYVYGNHDQFRSITRVDNNIEKARILALFQLTARGVPFVYQGEEIGMTTGNIPVEKGQDPLAKEYANLPEWVVSRLPFLPNRDNCRTPMQWNDHENGGFSTAKETWLPVQSNFDQINVQGQLDEPGSLLNSYISLLQLRKTYPALQQGDLQLNESGNLDNSVLAFTRKLEEEEITVCLNFSEEKQEFSLGEFVGVQLLWSTGKKVLVNDEILFLPPLGGAIITKK